MVGVGHVEKQGRAGRNLKKLDSKTFSYLHNFIVCSMWHVSVYSYTASSAPNGMTLELYYVSQLNLNNQSNVDFDKSYF